MFEDLGIRLDDFLYSWKLKLRDFWLYAVLRRKRLNGWKWYGGYGVWNKNIVVRGEKSEE